MTTDQIVISFAVFSFVSLVSLIVFLWKVDHDKINKAVTKEQCEERKKIEDRHMDSINRKLCTHDHDEEGRVRVILHDDK